MIKTDISPVSFLHLQGMGGTSQLGRKKLYQLRNLYFFTWEEKRFILGNNTALYIRVASGCHLYFTCISTFVLCLSPLSIGLFFVFVIGKCYYIVEIIDLLSVISGFCDLFRRAFYPRLYKYICLVFLLVLM